MGELGKPVRGYRKEMLRRAAEERAKPFAKPARRRRVKKAGTDDEGGSAPAACAPADAEYAQAEQWVRGGLFKEGGKPGPGRPKGSLNKNTATMKQALIDVFNRLQDEHPGLGAYPDMFEWAKDNKTEFYRHAMRLVPFEVNTRNESVGLVIFKGLNG